MKQESKYFGFIELKDSVCEVNTSRESGNPTPNLFKSGNTTPNPCESRKTTPSPFGNIFEVDI